MIRRSIGQALLLMLWLTTAQAADVTIESLKNVVGTTNGEVKSTRGYYALGDCEPLVYRWDASSTAADNGADATHPGTLIEPSTMPPAGRWIADEMPHTNVRWFGAKGDNSQDDQPFIQAAIDHVVSNNDVVAEVYIPAGQYKITSELIVYRDLNSDGVAESVSMRFRGDGGFPYSTNLAKVSWISCTHKDTFAIGIHRAKGLRIENLYISGQNDITFSTAKALFEADEATDFVVNGCRNNAYSPYAAIAIDWAGSNTSPAAADRYPGLDSYYVSGQSSGGSTDIQISECRIEGFVTGIILSPSGFSQNAEQVDIARCRIEKCKALVAPCNLQSRSFNIRDITCWGNTLHVVDCSSWGEGSGQLPFFYGGNFAGAVKYLFQSAGPVQQGSFNNVFAETIYAIGKFNGSNLSFQGCMFKFTYPSATTSIAPTILSSNDPVSAFGCTFIHSANSPDSKPLVFACNQLNLIGCTFDVLPLNRTYQKTIYHQGTSFRHLSGSAEGDTDHYGTGATVTYPVPGNKNGMAVAPGQSLIVPSWNDRKFEVTAPRDRLTNIEGGTVSVTFAADQTATFTSSAPGRWREGDTVLFPSLLTDSFGNSVYGTASITDITGSTVTLSGVPTEYAPANLNDPVDLYPHLYTPYRWHEPSIGDVTNGSNVIANVESTTANTLVWRAGQRISGAGIPEGTYVVSSNATSITISVNATATNSNVDLYDAPLRTKAWAAAAPTTGSWTKGTVIFDSTGATNGWRCTSSGTFGSTNPTFAAM